MAERGRPCLSLANVPLRLWQMQIAPPHRRVVSKPYAPICYDHYLLLMPSPGIQMCSTALMTRIEQAGKRSPRSCLIVIMTVLA